MCLVLCAAQALRGWTRRLTALGLEGARSGPGTQRTKKGLQRPWCSCQTRWHLPTDGGGKGGQGGQTGRPKPLGTQGMAVEGQAQIGLQEAAGRQLGFLPQQ